MDYWTWGKEYLDQADRLGKRIESLRKQQKSLSGRTAAQLQRRIALLYSMYLECRSIGRRLQRGAGVNG